MKAKIDVKLLNTMVDMYLDNLKKNQFSYGVREALKALAIDMGFDDTFHKILKEKRDA